MEHKKQKRAGARIGDFVEASDKPEKNRYRIPAKEDARGPDPIDGVETMAMPQRDDMIEAIKRRAAEKRTAEEKKNAEARARAAYQRKQWQGTRCRLKASRRQAGTGEEGMGESPAPVQAPRAVAVTGCGEGVNVV